MTKFTNAHHLQTHSYQTQDKLRTRILIHEKYTQPKLDFITWVLDKVSWLGDETVLDVGCGSGAYLEPARQRCRGYIACDLSMGMLRGLPAIDRINLNVQQLPFASQTADIVLANHMLYHVPDQSAALAEIARVLKPGGKLVAATNSENSMSALRELQQQAMHRLGLPPIPHFREVVHAFSLENGRSILQQQFSTVTRHDSESMLVLPEPQPILDYIASSRDWYEEHLPSITWDDFMNTLNQILAEHFACHSDYCIHKLIGVFLCEG